MPRMKLTEKAIAKLRAPDPSGRQRLFWDTELKGFGIVVSGVTNVKSFVVQRDVGGRTRRITIAPTNVLGLDEARREAESKLADLYKGLDPKSGRGGGTLRETLDQYLAANHHLRDKTRSDYRASVERHLDPWLDMPLREITAEMVEARHRAIKAKVEKAHDRSATTGHASANDAMRVLRLLWNFAAERAAVLPPNPVGRLRRQWYPVHRRERFVHDEDLPRFYASVQALANPIARDFLTLLLFTGLRRSEAASLRWDDVDFAARVIRLPAARTKSGRKLDLPMSDFVRDLLVARRAIGKETFVFPSASKSGHIAEPKFPLAQVREATGIRISAHDLRRTYITAAESADISPIALRALVNHSLGGDVTSGYIQMSAERLREPAQKVADKIKQLCGIEPAGGNVAELA